MKKLIGLGTRYPWQVLVLLTLVTALAAAEIPRLKINIGTQALTIPTDPSFADFEEFKKRFPQDEGLVLVFRDPLLFTEERLIKIGSALDEIKRLPYVSRAISLFSLKNVKNDEGTISSRPFLPPLPATPAEAAPIIADALANPLIASNLISADGTTLAAQVVLKAPDNDPDFDARVVKDIEEILKPIRPGFEEAFQLGGAVVRAAITERIQADGKKTLSWSIGVLLVTLALMLRRLNGAFIPLATGLLSVVWTLGFMALTGISLNVMTSMVPALLIIIGSTEGIHLIAEYYKGVDSGLGKREALGEMGEKMGMAVFLTALTTYVGFFSIITNDIVLLREFGLVSSTGILLNFLITAAFVPAWLALTDRGVRRPTDETTEGETSTSERRSAKASGEGTLMHRAWLAVFLVLSAIALIGSTRVEVDNDPLSYFPADEPLLQRTESLGRHLAGAESFSILLRSRIEDTFLKVRYLKEIRKLQQYLDGLGLFDKTLSLSDYVAFVNTVMEGSAPSQPELPESDDVVREYMLFADRDDIADYVSADFSEARIVVRHRISSSGELSKAVDRIHAFAGEKVDKGLDVVITGEAVVSMRAMDTMVIGQAKSLTLVIFVIWLIISILFVNVRAGLLAVLPNLFPIVGLFGVMGYLEIPLNPSTAMVAAIALGLCIDDTLVFMVRYHRHTQALNDQAQAIRLTLKDELRPILITSLALALGFSVFWSSSFPPVVDFGLLSALMMLIALAAVLVLLPILLGTLRLITLYDMLSLYLRKEVIEKCDLFACLKSSQIKKIVLNCEVRELPASTNVLVEGETGDEMFVLLEGEISVRKRTAESGTITIAQEGPGQVFGEMALITHQPRSATVMAETPAKLLVLKWEDIQRISRFYPRISSRLFQNLAGILSRRLAQRQETSPHPYGPREASFL